MSYKDHPEIRMRYDWATIETVETIYSCGTRKDTRRHTVTECLFKNREESERIRCSVSQVRGRANGR